MPSRLNEAELTFAEFLTRPVRRADHGLASASPTTTIDDKKTGTFAMHTLGDDETIARLATGIKRFKLPDEFNFIKIYDRIAGRGKSHFGDAVHDQPGQQLRGSPAVREGRRRLEEGHRRVRPAAIDSNYPPGSPGPDRRQLGPFRAGPDAARRHRARPSSSASATATRSTSRPTKSRCDKLLDDVKAYLEEQPRTSSTGSQINIGNIGYRLVEQQQTQYIGDKVGRAGPWTSSRARPTSMTAITVTTPLKKPGAYLVTAKMADGNISRIIVWVADTVILKKQLDGQAYYYVADAVTGQPVAEANARLLRLAAGPGAARTPTSSARLTTGFTDNADEDGQLILGPNKQTAGLQLAHHRHARRTDGERIASPTSASPASGTASIYDPEYNATTRLHHHRPSGLSSRAEGAVQDLGAPCQVRPARRLRLRRARRSTSTIHNPKGEKVFEKSLIADEYGGVAGD